MLDFCYHDTPLGMMMSYSTGQALYLLSYGDCSTLKPQTKQLAKHFTYFQYHSNKISKLVDTQLRQYFQGERSQFDIPLHCLGTDFQKNAWQTLSHIPYGKTISYREQAERTGKPKAIRAVANANRLNKLSIIVPCHRVISSNKELGGYAGGLDRKNQLLALEEKYFTKLSA